MPFDRDEMVEILAELGEATEVDPLRALVMRGLSLIGSNAAFFVAPLSPDPRVPRILTNIGLPHIWERYYRARLYMIDPLPALSLRKSNAFFWPDELSGTSLSRQEERYLQIAARYGLAKGIGVACYGPHGRAGFLGVSWTKEDAPSKDVLQAVHQLGQTGFQRYCAFFNEEMDIDPLSNRELEVLGWMCQGKSNPDIADIIGVSRSSVDAYIRRIFAKLNVTDRTAACVRAFSIGLIASNEIARLIERAKDRDES